MEKPHAAVLSACSRIQRYLDIHDASLGDINQSGYRAVLNDVVSALHAHDVTLEYAQRAGTGQTAKRRVLRNILKLNHLRPIARIAAAQLRQVPEFAALAMPSCKSPSRALIAAAGAMRVAASGYPATFMAAGLDADFLEQLQGAADALNANLAESGAMECRRSGATAGLAAEAKRGRQAIKVLDALVEKRVNDDVLRAEWNSARRIGGRSASIASVSHDAAFAGAAQAPDGPALQPVSLAAWLFGSRTWRPGSSARVAALALHARVA